VNVSIPPGTVAATTATGRAHQGHGPGKQTMDAVAKELGMSTDDLQKALGSGQSMTDLATKAGVSKDDLVTTIAATLPGQGADGRSVDPTEAATRIADHVRGSRPSGPPPSSSAAPSGSALGQGVDALSSALGISSDDLMKRLTEGSYLQRESDPRDRRVVILRATTRGTDAARAFFAGVARDNHLAMADLPDEDLEAAHRTFRAMVEAMRSFNGTPDTGRPPP